MAFFRWRWSLILVTFGACGCAGKQPATGAVEPTTAQSTEIITMVPTPTYQPRVPVPEVNAVEFSADRKWLAVGTIVRSDPLSGTIAVRDCASNRVVKSWNVPGGVRYLAISPDGADVVVTNTESKLLVYRWKSGQLLHESALPDGADTNGRMPLDYAPDGRTLAVAVGEIQLYNAKTWKRRELRLHPVSQESMSNAITFSPDGQRLLISDGFEGYSGYTICSVADGRARQKANYMPYSAPIFSHDGRRFAGLGSGVMSSNEEIREDGACVFDARTLKLKRRLSPDFKPIEFSPDDQFLAGVDYSDGASGKVEIWNVRTGKRTQQFQRIARVVTWRDAKTLLAGDENGVRKLSVNRG